MMAKAPSAARAAQARAATEEPVERRVQLMWRGRDYSFSMDDLGPGDDAECRRQSGYGFSGLVSELQHGAKVGTDIIATLLWMGRRKHGEPDLELQQVFKDVGTNEQLMADLQLGPAGDGVLDVGEAEPPGE